MKEKMYVASSLQEVEELAVKELAVAKDDMYFDVISEKENEVEVNVIVDAPQGRRYGGGGGKPGIQLVLGKGQGVFAAHCQNGIYQSNKKHDSSDNGFCRDFLTHCLRLLSFLSAGVRGAPLFARIVPSQHHFRLMCGNYDKPALTPLLRK